jgi:hypothetical protein
MASPTINLKAPGPGYRNLRFSDGSSIWMPPGATDADYQDAWTRGQAQVHQQRIAQAARENRPIQAGDYVYSATSAHPNTVFGNAAAWLDHNAGGNALNRNPTAQAVNDAVRPAMGAVNRVATQSLDAIPLVGIHDLIASGGNVAKHALTRAIPSLANVPDFYTAVGAARNLAGTPELPANAPDVQKIVEGVASSMNPRQSLLGVAARTAGGYYGGKIGDAVAGEPGQFFGSLAGAGPDATGNVGLRVAGKMFGGDQASEVAAAGRNIGVQPTFGMVANPTGRRLEKGLGSFPVLGGPIQSAQARAAQGLEDTQQRTTETLNGSPLPFVSPASIGADLSSAARQGAANITHDAQSEQGALASRIGANQPVDIRSVYRGPAGYPSYATTDPTTFEPLAARLDRLRQMAIEAQKPAFQAVSGVMPAGTAPYARVQSARSSVGADIPGASGMDLGVQKNLYGALTQAMRNAAIAKDPALGPAFDFANENYQRIMGQGGERQQLESVGGKPVGGYSGLDTQSGGTVMGAPFRGGKDEGSAFNYLTSNLNSPGSLDLLSNPSVVPNDMWRRVAAAYVSTLGQTKEGTYRPDIMAQQWGKIAPEVRDQLFTGPTGQPILEAANMDDAATMGREAVVPVERAGLTNTAGTMLGVKTVLDALRAAGGLVGSAVGGRFAAKGLESAPFVNAMSGNVTPFVDALYAGAPQGLQNIQQFQQNPQAQ